MDITLNIYITDLHRFIQIATPQVFYFSHFENEYIPSLTCFVGFHFQCNNTQAAVVSVSSCHGTLDAECIGTYGKSYSYFVPNAPCSKINSKKGKGKKNGAMRWSVHRTFPLFLGSMNMLPFCVFSALLLFNEHPKNNL